MQSRNQINKLINSPVFWIFLFIICISPLALNYILHYVDELHYTDAAIQMLNSHDYFTPKQANGESRFLKPILSYWMIVTSYKIFGVSQFSSRLPFLLCGITIIWITYKTAFKLTKNKEIALLSLLIVMSNPLLILSSSRSIPDIPQALFLGLAILGIAGILSSESPNKKDLWLFYLGFSLAFETKGIPALIFMAISTLFLLLNPWKRTRFSSLINWPAIIVALLISLWWYILMYYKHGNEFLFSFFNDQVGERISEDRYRILRNFLFSIITPIGYFIFWIIPFFKDTKKNNWHTINKSAPVQLFSVLSFFWFSFLFLSSIFTVKFYDRYFLPVFPLLAIIIAYNINKKEVFRYFNIINVILVLFGILFSVLSIFIAIRLNNAYQLSLSILVSSAFIFIFFLSRKNPTYEIKLKKTATLLLLIIFSSTVFISNFALPDQGSQIAYFLKRNKIENQKIALYGEKKVAAKIRVASNAEIDLDCIEPGNFIDIPEYDMIIFREDQPPGIADSYHQVQIISTEWNAFPIISILKGDTYQSSLKKHQINYKIASTKNHL